MYQSWLKNFIELVMKLWRGYFPKEIKEMNYIPVTPESIDKLKEQIPSIKFQWDTPQNVRLSLRKVADEEGLSLIQKDLACDICYAESGYNPKARLVNTTGSVDRGLFQINSYWHKQVTDEQAYDPEFNARWGCRMIKAGKTKVFWSASMKNWNKNNKYQSLLT